MRKLILMAAMAATVLPTAALAQEHNRDRQHGTEMRHDQHNMRSDRHQSRNDRHVVRQGDRTRSHRVAYVAPVRNWSYRPVNVGYRLQPSFYGSRYYVSDYGSYNLRAPGRWQQWIRYGNDLLLVNVRTGRVLQVIHYRGW